MDMCLLAMIWARQVLLFLFSPAGCLGGQFITANGHRLLQQEIVRDKNKKVAPPSNCVNSIYYSIQDTKCVMVFIASRLVLSLFLARFVVVTIYMMCNFVGEI